MRSPIPAAGIETLLFAGIKCLFRHDMIIGIGTDLIESKRVAKACQKQAFLQRAYTERERREAADNIRRLAGDFAVKEAVSKALGTGFSGFGPGDIEVLRDDLGKPYVCLYEGAALRAAQIGADRIHVSITDTEDLTIAFAVAETEA